MRAANDGYQDKELLFATDKTITTDKEEGEGEGEGVKYDSDEEEKVAQAEEEQSGDAWVEQSCGRLRLL